MAKKLSIPKPPSTKTTSTVVPPPPVIKKNFQVGAKGGIQRGKKILIYGESGIGKSTLASMLPNPLIMDLDNGCSELMHPKTGESLIGRCIQDVETYADVRGVLQSDVYSGYKSLVIDNATVLETLATQHVIATVPCGKDCKARNIESFGYGKGYRHLYDDMNLILQDIDVVLRKGINVCMLAQASAKTVANPDGEDYLREGPRLYSGKNNSMEDLYCEWADHLLRIGYQMIMVEDRKASSTGARAVFCKGQPHFRAKSRTLPIDVEVVSFAEPSDDSIWQFIFGTVQ
jgi:hypothetical protein